MLLLGSSGGSLTANKERPEDESGGSTAASLLFCVRVEVTKVDATANNQNNNSSTALEFRNNSTTETELGSFMTGVLGCLMMFPV